AKSRDQICELHFPPRRILGEILPLYFPAGTLELPDQVDPRLLDRFTARRTRAEVDHRLDVGKRLFARKILPDFSLLGARRLRVCAIARCYSKSDDENDEPKEQRGSEKSGERTRLARWFRRLAETFFLPDARACAQTQGSRWRERHRPRARRARSPA